MVETRKEKEVTTDQVKSTLTQNNNNNNKWNFTTTSLLSDLI